MKTLSLACAVCLLALGSAICSVEDERTVQITDKGFSPQRIEVTVGEKVTWKNMTVKEHTVTCTAKPALPGEQGQEKPMFDSGRIRPGDSFDHTFTKEGTYDYACTLDKAMTGTVIVRPSR